MTTPPPIIQIPMLLTWLRIVLIPLIVGVFLLPKEAGLLPYQNVIACTMFILAAITDAFDGYLARRWHQTSALGAFLDPVADKLMVCAALVVLVYLSRIHPLIALVIIGREITISALREWMATIGASKHVAVSSLGKLKTIAQMAAIPLLLLHQPIPPLPMSLPIASLGTILIWIAAALTVWSMCYYLMKAWPQIKRANSTSNV